MVEWGEEQKGEGAEGHGRETHLDSDVESRDVEGLEHDLSCIFAVLWCIERWLCLDKYTQCISSAQQLRKKVA